MSEGRLFVCATPIGNLADVSERLVETLRTVDIVYAEDTRRTATLMQRVGSDVGMRSFFAGNEKARTEEALSDLRSGRRVALVSDAGMPVVSDPGANLVGLAHDEGFAVTVIPGPSAVTAAVALSGFGGDRFVFEGFLPKKGKERSRRIRVIVGEERPVVLFATPHRLATDLVDLRQALGDQRRVAVARELTKIHEEVWLGTLAEAEGRFSGDLKGEFTLVIEPSRPEPVAASEAISEARELVSDGVSPSDAARRVSESTGVSRRVVYQALLEGQDRS